MVNEQCIPSSIEFDAPLLRFALDAMRDERARYDALGFELSAINSNGDDAGRLYPAVKP